jgi:hypothetical protein
VEAHVRGSIFFGSLLLAPALYALGDRIGGSAVAIGVSATVVAAALGLMMLGGSGGRPPAGTEPS